MDDSEITKNNPVANRAALTPLPHDGWRSRRAIGSSVASGVIFGGSTLLLLWSGHVSKVPFFSADNWLTALQTAAVVLGIGWGLLSVDKLLELKRGKVGR